jgi:hypothetical protein
MDFIEFQDFNDLKDYYNSYNKHRGCYIGSIGKFYNLKDNKVYNMGCKHWSCPRCRARKKYQLFLETYYLTQNLGMDKHFIMTFQGKEFREKIPYYQSFPIMNNIWHKYHKVIEYHKGKIDYLIFPRAQQDGYCHFHVTMPRSISWKFLDEKRKLYPEMGYVRINKNVDLAEYLHKDFFKDHEYVIPFGVKHFRSSRSLKINRFYNPFFHEDNAFVTGDIKKLEELVIEKFGRSLPLEEYVKQFVEIKNKED